MMRSALVGLLGRGHRPVNVQAINPGRLAGPRKRLRDDRHHWHDKGAQSGRRARLVPPNGDDVPTRRWRRHDKQLAQFGVPVGRKAQAAGDARQRVFAAFTDHLIVAHPPLLMGLDPEFL